MICCVCGKEITGACIHNSEDERAKHITCQEKIVIASEIIAKPKNITKYDKVDIDNPDDVIDDNVIGSVDA